MSGIKEITLENLTSDKSFFKDLADGDFVLVLGAGFSWGIENQSEIFETIPIVKQFTNLTQEKLGGGIGESEINKAVIKWKEKINSKEITFEELKKLFLVNEDNFDETLYKYILKVNWAGIYTFNFDNVLDVLIKEEKGSYDLQYVNGMFELDGRSKIAYLHNSIEKAKKIADLIFANHEYGVQQNNNNSLYSSMFNQLENHNKNLIIVGCGFAEQSIYKFLSMITRRELKIIHINFKDKPTYDPDFLKIVPNVSWIDCPATDFLKSLQSNEALLNPTHADDFDPYQHNYFGRVNELNEINKFFNNPEQHFLFLHGAGGIGKTHALKFEINKSNIDYKYVKLTEAFTIYTIADKLNLGKLNPKNRYNDFKIKIGEQEAVIIIDDLYNIRPDETLYNFIVDLANIAFGKIIILSRTLPEKYSQIGIAVKQISFELLKRPETDLFVKEYYMLTFNKEIDNFLLEKIWKISLGYPLVAGLLVENTIFPEFNIEDAGNWNFDDDSSQKQVIERLLETYLKYSSANEKELILDIATAIEDISLEIVKVLPSYLRFGNSILYSVLKRKHIIRYAESGKIAMHALIRELLYQKAGDRKSTHLAYANYYERLAMDSNYNNTLAFNLAYHHYRNIGGEELESFKVKANEVLVGVNVKQLLSENIDADIEKLIYRKNENPTDASTYHALGTLYRLKNDFDKCISILDNGLTLPNETENEYLLFNKAYSFMYFGKEDEAEQILDILVEKKNELGLKFKGKLLYNRKNYTEAEKLFNEKISAFGASAESILFLAKCKIKIHEASQAIIIIESYKGFEINPIMLNELANAYRGNKNLPFAINNYNNALKLKPNNIQSYDGIFRCYLEQFDYEKGIQTIDRMLSNNLKDKKLLIEGIYTCIDGKYKIYNYDKARIYLEQLKKIQFYGKDETIERLENKIGVYEKSKKI